MPRQFDYAAPGNVEEAVALLETHAGARVLAGGHDLLTQMKLRRLAPPFLVDLRKIEDLRGIVPGDDQIVIGAMTTCAQIAADASLKAAGQALVEAADSIGDAQVRNCATIGGNLAYGDPAADLPAALLVLEATIQVVGPRGPRAIAADRFFLGASTTALEPSEVITSVRFAATPGRVGSAYEKFRNPANGYPIVGVAAKVVRAPSGGMLTTCRLAVTGATAHPQRLTIVEGLIAGKAQIPETIAAACARAGEGLSLTTDIYASGEYRAHLTAVMAERALSRAMERAKAR